MLDVLRTKWQVEGKRVTRLLSLLGYGQKSCKSYFSIGELLMQNLLLHTSSSSVTLVQNRFIQKTGIHTSRQSIRMVPESPPL
jgi:hypothetical protein